MHLITPSREVQRNEANETGLQTRLLLPSEGFSCHRLLSKPVLAYSRFRREILEHSVQD